MFWKRQKGNKAASSSLEQRKGEILMRYMKLGVKIEQLIQQRNWGESRRYVEANPELLSPEVEGVFDDLSRMHQDRGRGVLAAIEEHRELLRRCREHGVDAGFQRYVRRPGGR